MARTDVNRPHRACMNGSGRTASGGHQRTPWIGLHTPLRTERASAQGPSRTGMDRASSSTWGSRRRHPRITGAAGKGHDHYSLSPFTWAGY